MKSRAAVLHRSGEPLAVEEIEVQDPRDGEVLIELVATGVCATDLGVMKGGVPLPAILGHEGAGIVRAVGRGVTSVAIGDSVVPSYVPECMDCVSCRHPDTNLCQADRRTRSQGLMPDRTSRFSVGGEPVRHFMGTSTFAQHTVASENSVARIRPDAPLDKVCYVGCGVTTGLGAVLFTARVPEGATVAVFGLGGVGLNVVQGARLAGAERIIGVDVNATRVGLGRRLGLTDFIDASVTDPVEAVRELTRGGVDFAFECVGSAGVARQALSGCRAGWGQLIVVGLGTEPISVMSSELILGKRVRGTAFGGARGRTDIPRIVDWYMEGRIEIDPLITHSLPLERINEAVEVTRRGEAIRAVVTFT